MAYRDSKKIIVCPICGKNAELQCDYINKYYYKCSNCSWTSNLPDKNGKKILDIFSADLESGCLSNLFPYNFDFYMSKYGIYFLKPIKCLSMESFLQGLKIKDPSLQKEFMESYSGLNSIKLKYAIEDWRKDGFVYINGYKIDRCSISYSDIITSAYDCLYETNSMFRELAIPYASKFHLIHSIGKTDPKESLLTESEYINQLTRLVERYNEKK